MNGFRIPAVLAAAVWLLGACAPPDDPQHSYELMKGVTFNSVTEGTGTYQQGRTHTYSVTGTGVVVGDRYLRAAGTTTTNCPWTPSPYSPA